MPSLGKRQNESSPFRIAELHCPTPPPPRCGVGPLHSMWGGLPAPGVAGGGGAVMAGANGFGERRGAPSLGGGSLWNVPLTDLSPFGTAWTPCRVAPIMAPTADARCSEACLAGALRCARHGDPLTPGPCLVKAAKWRMAPLPCRLEWRPAARTPPQQITTNGVATTCEGVRGQGRPWLVPHEAEQVRGENSLPRSRCELCG